MGIVQKLSILAVREVVFRVRTDLKKGEANGGTNAVAGVLAQEFGALGQRLTGALTTAMDRAWKTLEIFLGGVAWWQRGQTLLAAPEDQPLRGAIQTFLDSALLADLSEGGTYFRQECGREVRQARRAGLLDGFLDTQELAVEAAATWADVVEPPQMRNAEQKIAEQMAQELRRARLPHLARLLEIQGQSGALLVGSAVRSYFRRAVEQDETLRQRLAMVPTGAIGEPGSQGLANLAEVFENHEARLQELLETPSGSLEARGDSLDLGIEGSRLAPPLQAVAQDVLALLRARQLEQRELRPTDFLTLAGDEERRRIQQLTARYRAAPEDQRRQAPALLNAIAKLEALAGDFDPAQHDFQVVAALTTDPRAQAEAWANAYQLALERRQGAEALNFLKRAASLEAERFAPFPLNKYEPEAILRSDGFGVAFLCRHKTANMPVVIRSLWAEVLDREVSEFFHEAQVLESLELPAMLRLRDCDFADVAQTRPYLVREHFDGQTLADYVEQHGPLLPADLLTLMRPVVETLHAVHRRGILHRQLNPTSILLRKEAAGWRVKVLNFGLGLQRNLLRLALMNPAARNRTLLGQTAGRIVNYAAPEQSGRLPEVSVGTHSDVYSFGRTCYYALLRTPDPDDEEKETLVAGWRKLLGHCTAIAFGRRTASFEPVLAKLSRVQQPAETAAVTVPAVPAVALTPARPAAAVGTPSQRPAQLPAATAVRSASDTGRPAAVETASVKFDPEESAACVQRGVALRLKGDFDQALAEFNRAIRLDPRNALAYEGRGNTLVNKNEFDKAIADYTQALKMDPKLALVHVNRGLAYVKKKDIDSAIADYSAAIGLDARLPLAFLNRGSAFARKGEYDKAIADYTAALQLDNKLILAYFNRGLAYFKKGEYDKAIADYTRTLKLDPNNAQARARRQEADEARRQAAATPTPPAAPDAADKAKPGEPVLAREVRRFDGHTDAVRAVAYAPDGRCVLSASEDKTIRLWDIRTGKTMMRFLGHTGGVTCVAFAPEGDVLLSGSQDQTIRLWDVETGEELRRFGASRFFGGGNAHAGAVVSVSFAPDGLRALSASWDKTVRLWDVESGKELRSYEGHNWLIHSVAFSPDGKHFLYGSEDQTARLCEVETGQEIRRFEGHTSWVLTVAFSPDGKQVLTGSSDGTMRLWSVTRGRELRKFGGQMGLVQSVAFSPDGKQALSGEYTLPGENTIMRLWNIESGQEVCRVSGHQQLIWSVAFSPDGKYGLSGSADKTLRLWKLPK